MKRFVGWLFDLYAHPTTGIVLWLIGEDGKAYQFYQGFEISFYAYGPHPRLHELGVYLRTKYSRQEVQLERSTKEDLFAGSREVMCVCVSSTDLYKSLIQEVQENFSELIFYNADVPLT